MQALTLLEGNHFNITIQRLCYQLVENYQDFSDTVIIGLQPRGVYLSKRIHKELSVIVPDLKLHIGELDVTFFRDDFRSKGAVHVPSSTQIDFLVEGKRVILIDDVLWTGRTIRAGLDALLAFGRPQKVELMVLVDRHCSRHLPIEANYKGIKVDTIDSQIVKVLWDESDNSDKVILLEKE